MDVFPVCVCVCGWKVNSVTIESDSKAHIEFVKD